MPHIEDWHLKEKILTVSKFSDTNAKDVEEANDLYALWKIIMEVHIGWHYISAKMRERIRYHHYFNLSQSAGYIGIIFNIR
jgi:hypothetical protein